MLVPTSAARRASAVLRAGALGLLASALGACADGAQTGACDGTPGVQQSTQALSLKCTKLDFDVQLDPAAEDFGQIPCRMTTLLGYREDCPCIGDQFGPAPPDLIAPTEAAQRLENCTEEPPCVCEFLQSTGERQEICHRLGYQSTRPGWCWLDSELGDPSITPAACESGLRIIGRPRVDGQDVGSFYLTCQRTTAPSGEAPPRAASREP